MVWGVSLFSVHGMDIFTELTGKMERKSGISIQGNVLQDRPLSMVNGIMYFGCWDGHVYAVDISNGKEKWRFNMGSTEATPLLYENRLYIGSWDNNFYCIDLNGKEIWRFRAKDILGDFKPVVHNGIIYFGSIDKSFYALDVETGQLVWSFNTGGTIWSSPVCYEGLIIFGSWDCYLYALDCKTGEEAWRFQTSNKNPSFHVYNIEYSFGGSVKNVSESEGKREYEKAGTNVDLTDEVYTPLSQYVKTDIVYGTSKKKYSDV